ncbi:MAG: hypothetical protein E7555_04810 [Ruminococcaceae bacterium]|nr:hypothetical protein [Oscillospiraceae bacterium]
MSKVLGSWSGMRKYLEEEMLAESLSGRIRYGCTSYAGMDDCKIFEVCIDGKQVKRFSWETVNTYFIDNGFTQNKNPYGEREYWQEFQSLLERCSINDREEYTDEEFCSALERYRGSDIQKSISSENPLVRMFAVLDRRVGKRTLDKIKEDIENQPEWLKKFYKLRISAEITK